MMPPPNDATSAQWPDLVVEDSLGVCGVRDDTRAVAQAAAAGLPGRALDLGTGSGYVGLYLAQRGWTVDAVDVSLRAVDLARRNAARNGISLNIYQSDLFSQVEGPFDVIIFNPPMRPDESELTRFVTSLLRRSPRISSLLMNVVGERFETGRMDFLTQVLADARSLLRPGGRVIMGISAEEAEELTQLPWVRSVTISPIPSMPRQEVVEFQIEVAA